MVVMLKVIMKFYDDLSKVIADPNFISFLCGS